jgi:hypothetical protein
MSDYQRKIVYLKGHYLPKSDVHFLIDLKTRAVAPFFPDARTFHNIYKLQKHVLLRHQSYLIVFMGNKNLRFWQIMPLVLQKNVIDEIKKRENILSKKLELKQYYIVRTFIIQNQPFEDVNDYKKTLLILCHCF